MLSRQVVGRCSEQLIRNQQVAGSSPANGSKHLPHQHTLTPAHGVLWPHQAQRSSSEDRHPGMPESASVRAIVCRYIAEETPRKAASTRRHDILYATAIVDAWGDLPIEQVTPRLVAALHRDLSACTTEEIAAVLGHSSSATASRYVHLAGTFARDAAQRAGERVTGRRAA